MGPGHSPTSGPRGLTISQWWPNGSRELGHATAPFDLEQFARPEGRLAERDRLGTATHGQHRGKSYTRLLALCSHDFLLARSRRIAAPLGRSNETPVATDPPSAFTWFASPRTPKQWAEG
jgi:hypothetical protein